MKTFDDCYEKIIKFSGEVYRIFWNKKCEYFSLETKNDYDAGFIVIYNNQINDIIAELEKLRSLIDESKESEKSAAKPK